LFVGEVKGPGGLRCVFGTDAPWVVLAVPVAEYPCLIVHRLLSAIHHASAVAAVKGVMMHRHACLDPEALVSAVPPRMLVAIRLCIAHG
jgi:hypothetical protein